MTTDIAKAEEIERRAMAVLETAREIETNAANGIWAMRDVLLAINNDIAEGRPAAARMKVNGIITIIERVK